MDFKIDAHVSRDSPDITPLKYFQKGAWPGSRALILFIQTLALYKSYTYLLTYLNFWALNADTFKTVKVTVFKFEAHVSRDSMDMTPWIFFEKGAWPGSREPLNFWALNANSSKTVKATDFKFDKHVLRDSPGMTP